MSDIVTSSDGQWAVVHRGASLTLHAGGAGPAVASAVIDDPSDVEIVAVGPPSMFLVRAGNALALFQPPDLECVAIAKLDIPLRIAAVTGQRIALVSGDGKQVRLVRAAGRAMTMHALDVGSPVEFAVGLDRNQMLFGLHRKLEVWDAASGRPLLRLQLQLPPAPRQIGAAHGHLWAIRTGGDEVFVYRLSDGRPFRHAIGGAIDRVVANLGSQLVVLVTGRRLVRLHCLAHSLEVLELPDPAMHAHALALLPSAPDDVALVGCGDADQVDPWRAPITGAPMPETATAAPSVAPVAAPLARLERPVAGAKHVSIPTGGSSLGAAVNEDTQRAAIATYGAQIIRRARELLERGDDKPREAPRSALARAELGGGGSSLTESRRDDRERSVERLVEPAIDDESILGALAARLELPANARRALVALYGTYLAGEAAIGLAPFAHALGDWTEILGGGRLGALAMIGKRDGRARLRRGVTELLDGALPRAIRLVDGVPGAVAPAGGIYRVARDGRTDVEIERGLAEIVGRVGMITGNVETALLEARMHGAVAVATAAVGEPPRRVPHGAALVIVLYGSPSSWLADLPALPATPAITAS